MRVVVHVTPGARRETVKENTKGELVISVREEAERNQANIRVRQLVTLHYGVTSEKVRLVSGAHSKKKIYQVVL